MNRSSISLQSLSDVAETLLIPLYMRAKESQRPDALIKDERAVALVQQMHYDFSRFKFEDHDQVGVVLRTQEFDRHTRGFLARRPQAVVVHIGCGLDTRFERVDNGQVEWYDLDLPHVIELRRKLIGGEGARQHLLSCSVLDSAWLDTVGAERPRPFLFLAEGVLMYLAEAQVKSLVLTLQKQFPGAELVCDAWSPLLVWLNNRRSGRVPFGARYQWALKHGQDLESWGDGICLLDEWFLLDRPLPRLAASHQWMRHFPPLAKAAGIFHYRLGNRLRHASRSEGE